MIKTLEQAIDRIRNLPEDRQRYAADLLERIADNAGVYSLSDEERRMVRQGMTELDRGDAATEAEVRTVFDKYRQ